MSHGFSALDFGLVSSLVFLCFGSWMLSWEIFILVKLSFWWGGSEDSQVLYLLPGCVRILKSCTYLPESSVLDPWEYYFFWYLDLIRIFQKFRGELILVCKFFFFSLQEWKWRKLSSTSLLSHPLWTVWLSYLCDLEILVRVREWGSTTTRGISRSLRPFDNETATVYHMCRKINKTMLIKNFNKKTWGKDLCLFNAYRNLWLILSS